MGFTAVLHWSLHHRAAVLLLSTLLLVAGLWQALRLPVDVLPELTRPALSLHLEAPALSAEDAAAQLAQPVELALAGLPGLLRLRSSSVAGMSLVQLEFDWDTDAHRNRQLVTERLDTVRSLLPNGVQPLLGPQASLMGEILLVALRRDGDAGLRALRTQADWRLRPALLAVPGVAQVTVLGGEVVQWEVRPDPARLQQFGIGLEPLIESLRGHGENRGGGLASVDGRQTSVRGFATPFDPAALQDVAVAQTAAGPVWLGQVAEVVEGARTRRGSAGADGAPALILAVQKQPGADTREVTAAVEARLAQLDAQLLPGTQRSTLFRQADYLRVSITEVRDALLHGTLIVGLVLALFLAGGRANLISLIAIPVSVAGAVLALSALDLSLNTLTLGGLAIAVGELVDDAVVGVENVARRLREGGAATADTIAGATLEVRSGILQATLVIVAGFLPLFALGGVEGRLFASLGAAYVAAILVSLLVAATLTPVLCALGFLGADGRVPRERAWLLALRRTYLRLLARTLDHGRLLTAFCVLLLVLALAATASLPRRFLPALNESTLTLNLVLPPGIALEESERVGQAAERLVLELPEARSVGRRTGRAEADEHAEGVHYSELDVQLDASERDRAAILSDLYGRLSVLPGSVSISQPISHRLDHLLSGVRAPLAIKLFGDDAATLEALAAAVRAQFADLPRLAESGLDREGRVLETRIRVDAARAALYGLAPARVLEQVAELNAGLLLARLVDAPTRTDLVLRLPPEWRDPARLGELPVTGVDGPVPLRWVADIQTLPVAERIVHEDGRRRLLIALFPGEDADAELATLRERLAALSVPRGCELRLEGQALAAEQAGLRLGLLALGALLLMALVLHRRFGALAPVLIVLGGIPLAWIGGAFALWLSATPVSLASLVGFVTLAGIAARNSILKLGRYQDLLREQPQLSPRERVLRGSGERLVPVLMTSLVAAVSLLPLLIGGDAPGQEILHPVALVVFGGLIGSTILDSFVTPALFLRAITRSPDSSTAIAL